MHVLMHVNYVGKFLDWKSYSLETGSTRDEPGKLTNVTTSVTVVIILNTRSHLLPAAY